MGANAASSAADKQIAAQQQANALQKQIYDATVARESPFVSGGTNALSQLQNLMGIGQGGMGATNPILQMLGIGGPGGMGGTGAINPATFQGSPGYQFQKQQGLQAVTNSAAARGGLGGNALQALQASGTGMANQDWYKYLGAAGGAYQGLTGDLQNMATLGQNAAGNLGTVGTNAGNSIGSGLAAIGNVQGAGITAGANALGKGIGGATNDIGSLLLNPQFQSLLKGLTNSGGGGQPYYSLDPTNQSVGSYPGQGAPDSYFLPGGAGYGG